MAYPTAAAVGSSKEGGADFVAVLSSIRGRGPADFNGRMEKSMARRLL